VSYIVRFQSEVAQLQGALCAKDEALRAFRAHLTSEKFQGFEAGGSRKDWIAIRDVDVWLCDIIGAGTDCF
jgi:hypothetical protein